MGTECNKMCFKQNKSKAENCVTIQNIICYKSGCFLHFHSAFCFIFYFRKKKHYPPFVLFKIRQLMEFSINSVSNVTTT